MESTNKGEVQPNGDSQPDEIMSSLAKTVAAGKCILFLGAAVHCAPPDDSEYSYPPEHRPTSASALSSHLARKTGFAERFPDEGVADLKRVTQDFEAKYQRTELIREIKNAVHVGKKPSPILQLLAELDFPLVITTNYDQLFEDALRAVGKKPYISVFKKNEEKDEVTDDYPFDEDPTPDRPFIFKIHGDVIEGSSSIIITDEVAIKRKDYF